MGREGKNRVAVLGAGPAGLFTAHLLNKEGFKVALYESHSKPGGCASFFRRTTNAGPASFDAGATVLNGFSEGELMKKLIDHIGVEIPKPFLKIKGLYYRLPHQQRPFLVDVRSYSLFEES